MDDRLDPAQERVLRKVRRFTTVSALIMGAGFLALFAAIGYRAVVGWKSTPATIEGIIRLPAGSNVLSTTISGDMIAVTLQRQGVVETRLFDAKTRAPRGTIGYANEP